MPYTDTDDVSIYYEVEGDPADPVIVLIAGGGAQMIAWRPEFRAMLVDEGFRVVWFAATRSARWATTSSACSTTSGSQRPTSSATRWAG
jgi:pimeloyl-ACP methyl ester carboxylesterase